LRLGLGIDFHDVRRRAIVLEQSDHRLHRRLHMIEKRFQASAEIVVSRLAVA